MAEHYSNSLEFYDIYNFIILIILFFKKNLYIYIIIIEY